MRSNGLTASTYSPVADLEPQVADALLDDLKQRGIAAYTKPVESSTVAGFDRPEYRVGVKDRLYVDAARSEAVRETLRAYDADLDEVSDDLAWEQIVSGFDRPLGDDVAPWPDDENLRADEDLVDERDLATSDPAEDAPKARWGTRFGGGETSDDDDFLTSTVGGRDASRSDEEADEVERFVPDPPPPLPTLAPYQILAWVGLIGGPLLLIVAALASYALPGWAMGAAIVGFIGGFVTLVATMGNSSDDDWDPGNGAVV